MKPAESVLDGSELKKLIREKEKEANLVMSKLLLLLGVLGLCVWVSYKLGVWVGNQFLVNLIDGVCSIVAIIIAVIVLRNNGEGKFSKFLLFSAFLILVAGANIRSGFCNWPLYAFPIILTCRYFDKKLTTVIFSISEVAIFVSGMLNAFCYQSIGYLDLNTAILPSGTAITASEGGELFTGVVAANMDSAVLFKNTLVQVTIPQMLVMTLLAVVCLTLQKYFVSVMIDFGQMAKQKADMELEVANSRSRIMLSQIQPHFLYNALQAIMAIDGNPDETIEAIGDFGKYLRENLDVITSGDMVPFTKELTHVQRYVSLEELRFGEKVCVEYDIQAESFSIPAMTVQMMVENAIKHGISKKQYGGTVHVTTKEEDDQYVIIVEDDGLGFDKTKGKPQDGRSHVGLENIEARLKNLCGGTFEIESTVGEGTTATVRIPKK